MTKKKDEKKFLGIISLNPKDWLRYVVLVIVVSFHSSGLQTFLVNPFSFSGLAIFAIVLLIVGIADQILKKIIGD